MATIQDVRAINTYQRSFMWEVAITGNVALGLPQLAVYAKTVSIPQSAVDQVIINHKSSRTHHAGRDAAGHTVTLTFWDDEDGTVYRYFQNWMNLIHNEVTGGCTTRDVYASTLHVKLKDATDQVTTADIQLSLAFPTELSDINLSYDGSDPVEISVTLSYDAKVVV